ncbi:MAG: Flp pilus assembly complex ATPase component TadA, partial [Candidatus Methanomethyliales bacterium]|nr:Flp pilus assembly complex ATPase component TadA [Candidatus Methanomethylicales archaeon]
MKVKSYHTPYKTFSMETFEMVFSDPPPEHHSVIIRGKESWLFRHDQITIILHCIGVVKDMIQNRALPNCITIKKILSSLGSSLPSLIRSIGETEGRKCRRLWSSCNICEYISSSILPQNLRKICGIKGMLRALAPQRLPNIDFIFDSPAYRLFPFSVYMLSENDTTTYAPILEGIDVTELIRLHMAVKRIRNYERMHLEEATIDLKDIIEYRRRLASEVCGVDRVLLTYTTYLSVGLERIYPLLVDDAISDFYFDREETFAYIDHRDYGRCLTTVFLDRDSMRRLLTFTRIAADRALDRASPSIRATIKTREFHIRISADIPPLSIEGVSVSVRKFFKKPLRLNDLVSNGTITREAANYCMERIKERKNFTIYGESGSGKTTLAVALDLLTPKAWRKISVETEIVENVQQLSFGSHQVRLLVESSSEDERARRTAVLNSLLQKSPDYLFFGEVLSKEDSVALFQLLSAGLKCIHTIHADSAESLLLRWVYQHQIPVQLLGELAVIIHMQK